MNVLAMPFERLIEQTCNNDNTSRMRRGEYLVSNHSYVIRNDNMCDR